MVVVKVSTVSKEVLTVSVEVLVLVDVLWLLWRFQLYQWMFLYWWMFCGGYEGSYYIYGGSYCIAGCFFISI